MLRNIDSNVFQGAVVDAVRRDLQPRGHVISILLVSPAHRYAETAKTYSDQDQSIPHGIQQPRDASGHVNVRPCQSAHNSCPPCNRRRLEIAQYRVGAVLIVAVASISALGRAGTV